MATAKPSSESLAASLLPDEMVAGGLADDFDGVVREARYAPFDYMGAIDEDVLSIQLKIERLDVDASADEDERFITQNWSAGDLKNFVPSIDGATKVADASTTDEEGNIITRTGQGYFAIRVGSRTALNNTTNAAMLMRSVLDVGFPREKFSPDIRFMEGIKGHWNRMPSDKKGGQFKNDTPEQKERASKRDVLVITRLDGVEAVAKAGATASGKAKTTAATATTTASTTMASDIDAKLVEIVKSVVKPGVDAIKKTALSGVVLKATKGDKQQNAMVKRVTTTEFLESLSDHNILFDAEAGTVEAIAVDE